MKTWATNRRATFDYELIEKYEAGLVLKGYEVKAVKAGKLSLAGSFITLHKGEAWLTGATIAPYQPKNTPDEYNPERSRKLLLKKNELEDILQKGKERGLTFIPIRVYTQNAKLKLEFALAKGKKAQDKRETIKRREAEREMKSHLKYS